MFRRKLKKEKLKYRFRMFFLALLVLSFALITFEYLSINFSFGKVTYISPIANQSKSRLASLESILDRNKIIYSSVDMVSDGSYRVQLRDSGEVILSSKKDLGSQLTSLQLILSRLTIEGKKLKELDFRFGNPVVSFYNYE
jgi:hypothetical protein